MFTCSKTYCDIPFAHRAPKHDGHCRLIHGHNWSITIVFAAEERDANGFVVDFGKLKELREALMTTFDHALVLNNDDPLKDDIKQFLQAFSIDNIVLIPDCSCEGLAKFVFHLADAYARSETKERAHVREVMVKEDSKNTATYVQDQ